MPNTERVTLTENASRMKASGDLSSGPVAVVGAVSLTKVPLTSSASSHAASSGH